MNRTVLVIGLIAISLLVATACSGDDEEPTDTPTDTAATTEGVYDNLPLQYGEIIPAETDCELLQDIFDIADNAHSGHIDAGRTDEARSFTRVMVAADHRMEEAGCYD